MTGLPRAFFSLAVALVPTLALVSASYADPRPDNQPLRIHLDAARSGAAGESGHAIEYGIRVALESLDNQLGGCPVTVTVADHRGSSVRSKRHLERFIEDSRGLAVFSGLHSPPLLAHREFINANGILLLNPWAAAGPITRSAARPNWIYRLSVDDYVAGEAMVSAAIDKQQKIKAGLLLEQTGWGDSNLRTMQRALQDRNLEVVSLQRFRWGMGPARAAEIMANLVGAEVNAVFMVANVEEGAHLVNAMADLPLSRRIPIYSHWGITGGRFVDLIGIDTLSKIDLHVLQSRFSFLSPHLSSYAKSRFKKLRELVPAIEEYKDLKAVSGFAHAHDLILLLNEAAQGINCSDPAVSLRRDIRDRLEKLSQPVQGLVKTYRRPFTPPMRVGDASHEALNMGDLTLGRFGASGEIHLDEELPARTASSMP